MKVDIDIFALIKRMIAMIYSNKDFESLGFLYQAEDLPKNILIEEFCTKHRVDYPTSDTWYRKTHKKVCPVIVNGMPANEEEGMIPIEAESCGTPVIAYGHGGSLETVSGGKTGLFFKEQTAEAIMEAVNRFEAMGDQPFSPKDCRKWAEGFSEERFKKEMKEFVEQKYEEFNS